MGAPTVDEGTSVIRLSPRPIEWPWAPSEADLRMLEARNEMGDITGSDVRRLIDAIRLLRRNV